MNNPVLFLTSFLFLIGSSSILSAQCTASTAAEFAACLPNPADGIIMVTADMDVPGPLDLSGVTVDLGNQVNLTLPAETVVDASTSFVTGTGNTDLTVIVGGTPYSFGKNGSPDLDDLNAEMVGGATTLGEAAELANGVLPVSLLSFDARVMAKKVMLTWVVAEEFENESFEISISNDGFSFQPVTIVDGRGSAFTTQSYEVSDVPAFSGNVYYRLTQRDFSGANRELGIRSVRWEADAASGLSVFPNPGKAGQTIRLQGVAEASRVDLLGMNGQVLRQLTVESGQTIVPNDIAAGVYLLRVPGKEIKPVRLVIK
ncbi:T9SS type A sorting domain-containing protein [Neolewinella agarilytica]|uniref:Por secretion system C-terminal sorting domain-containing protein n=1 Tax=Neolewinella agarilytica TaxID=478744 RepID=A0A1H9BIV6_9BACT|nr:T9SS type A sorting domain-containing protein [Neolewinella agarilytica]SEP88553.1 Por secretion system C-terminal sorting domain-containing protein [Neolewinella agarilytica]